jgi:hypothetical protein
MSLLLCLPVSAEVIRRDTAYACNSLEASVIFALYKYDGNQAGIRDAVANRECIKLPQGLQLEVRAPTYEMFQRATRIPRGSLVALRVRSARLPNDPREWWIDQFDVMTYIEIEQWLAHMDAVAKEREQEKRPPEAPKPKTIPPSQPRLVGPKWSPIPLPLPIAKTERKSTPALLFKEARNSVWAVVALKKLAGGDSKPMAQGSAVAISPTYLVTNCHVAQGADRLVITQNVKTINVTLWASHGATDRCILISEEEVPIYIRGVKRFSDMEIGERVFTVGSPRGLEHTLGDGLVSGLRTTKSGRYVQTNAPISPGSSGGALFDEAGNLVGITTFMLKESQALNFAIAAEDFWKP